MALRFGWLSRVIVVSALLVGRDSEARKVGGPTGRPPVLQTSSWQTHIDATYGFAIGYPNDCVILKEGKLPTPTQLPAVQRVRFQQKEIAAGQFADLEPPRFTIHVFKRSSGRSLRDWLDSSGLLPLGSEISAVRLKGAGKGFRVGLRQQLAPNEFVYFATEKYVYGLIPLGPESGKMLASFRLIKTP